MRNKFGPLSPNNSPDKPQKGGDDPGKDKDPLKPPQKGTFNRAIRIESIFDAFVMLLRWIRSLCEDVETVALLGPARGDDGDFLGTNPEIENWLEHRIMGYINKTILIAAETLLGYGKSEGEQWVFLVFYTTMSPGLRQVLGLFVKAEHHCYM